MIIGKKSYLDQVNVINSWYLDNCPNAINEKGTYFISKFKNSKVATISLLKRKDSNAKDVPGPGAYEAYDNTSP